MELDIFDGSLGSILDDNDQVQVDDQVSKLENSKKITKLKNLG